MLSREWALKGNHQGWFMVLFSAYRTSKKLDCVYFGVSPLFAGITKRSRRSQTGKESAKGPWNRFRTELLSAYFRVWGTSRQQAVWGPLKEYILDNTPRNVHGFRFHITISREPHINAWRSAHGFVSKSGVPPNKAWLRFDKGTLTWIVHIRHSRLVRI